MKMRKIQPKKYKMMSDSPAKVEHEPIYPRFRIELEHLPEAKKWEIGKEYEVHMKLKMTGISISKFQNDTEFEIKEIGVGSSKEDSDEEDGE